MSEVIVIVISLAILVCCSLVFQGTKTNEAKLVLADYEEHIGIQSPTIGIAPYQF